MALTGTLKFNVVDDEQSQVKLTIDWGDGQTFIDPAVPSNGQLYEKSHTYATAGTYTYKITADDLQSQNNIGIHQGQWTITGAANNNPTIQAIQDKVWPVNQSIVPFAVLASDPDGDTLTYTVTGLPAGVTFNPTTKQISGTPTVAQNAVPVTVQVTDSKGGSAQVQFNATVIAPNVNNPPVITFTGTPAFDEAGNVIGVTPSATDPQGDTITYQWSVVSKPASSGAVTFSNPTSISSGIKVNAPLSGGTYVFRLTATDSKGSSSSKDLTVVKSTTVNIPPIVLSRADVNTKVGTATPATSPIVVEVNDPNGDSITSITATGLPPGMTASPKLLFNKLEISGTPTTAGSYTVTVTATDAQGAQGSRAFNIIVAAINTPPIITVDQFGPVNTGGGGTTNTPPVIATTSTSTTKTGGTVITPKTEFGIVGSDADGDTLTYSWTPGTGLSYTDFSNAQSIDTTVTLPTVAGTYALTLNVSDGTTAVSKTFTAVVQAASGGVTGGVSNAAPTLELGTPTGG